MTTTYEGDWPDALPEDVLLLPVGDSPSFRNDPAGFMACALTRAKWWLMRTDDIRVIYDALRVVNAYTATLAKPEFGHFKAPPHNAALEIERRLERRLGILINEGQAEGIYRDKTHQTAPSVRVILGLPSTTKVIATARDMATPTVEDFDAAIDLAREEDVVSRAAVFRHFSGGKELYYVRPDVQGRSDWNTGKRKNNSNRMIQGLADDLIAATTGLDLIEADELDVLTKLECLESIQTSIRKLQGRIRQWQQTKNQ